MSMALFIDLAFQRNDIGWATNYMIGWLDEIQSGSKGWGQSAKLGTQSAICSKLGTALQGYTLSPCTKFPPNPTSRKVNTKELTFQHHA